MMADQKEKELQEATEHPQFAEQADEIAEERVKLMKYAQRRGEVADKSHSLVKQQQQRVKELHEDLRKYTQIPIPNKTWEDPFEDYVNGKFVPNKDKKPKKKKKKGK